VCIGDHLDAITLQTELQAALTAVLA
jgi:hypothetical protein